MLRTLLQALVTLGLAVVAVFFLIHLVPGDPAQIVLGEKATPQAIESIRKELGLDRPLAYQLGSYISRLASGDLGLSIRTGREVSAEILDRLPATLELSIVSLILSALIGILLGAFAAKRPGGFVDLLLGGISVLGLSLPVFFLGLILVYIFGLQLEWFPISGRLSYSSHYEPMTGFVLLDSLLRLDFQTFWIGLQYIALPAIALATVPLSLIARLMRSSLLETLRADFIKTARAKGAPERTVFFRHALRNALLPVITMLGFQFGLLLGGAILTENVFAWPGMGRWIVASVEGRDYPAIQGGVLIFATGIIVVMAITEFVHQWVDPRLRLKG